MRNFVGCVLVTCLLWTSSFAQSGDWAAVEGLAPGTDIWVKTAQGKKLQGQFESADPERLILWSQERSFPGRAVVKRELSRHDVNQVRLVHRMTSMAAGAAIGAGVGAGMGVALDATAKNHEDRGLVSFVFGMLGAGLGAAIGRTHPFIKGSVIYQAP